MLSQRLPAGGNSFDLSIHRSNLIVVPGDSTAFGGVPHAIFDSSSAAAEACARDLDAIIAAAQRDHQTCRIGVCGGNAARLVITQLTTIRSDFERVEFFLADERCVPVHDARRNDHLLIELLVAPSFVHRASIHSIPAELGPFEGAQQYATLIGKDPQFDVVFLSVGDDGHIASVFPDHSSSNVNNATVAVTDAPREPAERVSLSITAMRGATHRLVAAFGAQKSTVIARIHAGWDPPAVQVQPTRWYLDRAAAQDICG